MAATLEILLTGDDETFDPATVQGPPARAEGASAVPSPRARQKDDSQDLGRLSNSIRTLGKDLTEWLGLDRLANLAERVKRTIDNVRDVIDASRPAARESAPDLPAPRPAAPTRPGNTAPTQSAPTRPVGGPAPPHLPPLVPGKPTHQAPAGAAPPIAKLPTPPVVGPPAAASGVVGPAAGATSEAAAASLSGLAAAAGPAAIAVAGFAVAVGAAALVAKLAFDALKAEVRKLEGYSAPVAASTARNELRNEMSLLRRGEEIGPQLAKFSDDMGQWNEASAELWTQILKVILEFYKEVRPAVEFARKLVELTAAGTEMAVILRDEIRDMFDLTRDDRAKNAAAMQKALGKISRILEGRDEAAGFVDPHLQAFLGQFGFGMPAGGAGGRRPRARIAGGVAAPLMRGGAFGP